MAVFTGRSRWLVAALLASTAGLAQAEDIDAKLDVYENEARQIATNLPRPNQTSGAAGQRRLVDAEIAFALGNYDAAALMLFDLASRPGTDRDTASYYLAESLFQKGDRGAARGYYEQVVSAGNVASKYYQPALVRLVEISIAQSDDSKVGEYTAALDRVSPGLRQPQVPYVRGKLSYSQGKHDEALAYLQEVPKGSAYEMQAAYYTATVQVAKKDLQRATDLFTDLIGRKPRTASDRRIIELSQLALGRLYYERDQMSKSIDSYLLVDRHSDLFPDALYEVAWVYVKSKQYDKALRALELLALSDPQSQKTPTVRILEGNLRIRKAQLIRNAQIQGTIDSKEHDDPATEYDRAAQVFTETHDMYLPSYVALSQMAESGASAEQYLTQIAGRSEHVFQAAAPIPEAAVQYLRDEPEVQRVVAVESDLGEINANLAEAEATIARLEGVLAAGDRTAVYPALASRRTRIAAVQDGLIKLRSDLAEQELRLVNGSGELAQLSAARKRDVAAYTAMPNAEHVAAERVAQSRAQYDAIEATTAETLAAIGSTQAMAVALRKYAGDTPEMPADQKATLSSALHEAWREAAEIETTLDGVHMELQIGRDLVSVGDEATVAARAARKRLKAAEDAEHKLLAGAASASKDRRRSQQLVALADRATRLAEQLDQTEAELDNLVDLGLQEVRITLAHEKGLLERYKAELADHEAQARSIGGAALAASFGGVRAKFYDIVIRTDVGNVDVAWSQKEDTDDDLKRLNLSRQRELKQLRDEFRDVLEAGTHKPSEPAAKPSTSDMPKPDPNQPSGSPDKGAVEPRVTPTSDKPQAPALPTVRPDATKTEPRAGAPKAAAGKGGSR